MPCKAWAHVGLVSHISVSLTAKKDTLNLSISKSERITRSESQDHMLTALASWFVSTGATGILWEVEFNFVCVSHMAGHSASMPSICEMPEAPLTQSVRRSNYPCTHPSVPWGFRGRAPGEEPPSGNPLSVKFAPFPKTPGHMYTHFFQAESKSGPSQEISS